MAFVGTRPMVPDKVSEPLLVIVDNRTGAVVTHSLVAVGVARSISGNAWPQVRRSNASRTPSATRIAPLDR